MTEPCRAPSRSRRSYPNLHNLSLAPLSAKFPLDASAPPSPDERLVHTPRTSYIASKTAPSTPGILSLSQSRSNSRTRRSKPHYAYDGYFVNANHPVRDAGEIPKAKSASTLHGVSFADGGGGKATSPMQLRMPLVRHHTSSADDEWWHRAGLAIAGETRDSKGQGWLVRRESSTSLVAAAAEALHDTQPMALLSGEHVHAQDVATWSPRMSRAGSRYHSRVGSRVASARQSRRGSRVGSKIDVGMSPASTRHSLEVAAPPSLDARFLEPDFVEEAGEESSGDEEEVARLARSTSTWLDRLIGWTLFDVDEDREGSSDEDEDTHHQEQEDLLPQNMTREELRLRREVDAKRRKLEREAIVAAAKVKAREEGGAQGDEGRSRPSTAAAADDDDEVGGWQDAAWLLSVASKALF
ncbi:hypothetical protein ACEQ8H_002006 [Pleosporales sp. CAS-2024a]